MDKSIMSKRTLDVCLGYYDLAMDGGLVLQLPR